LFLAEAANTIIAKSPFPNVTLPALRDMVGGCCTVGVSVAEIDTVPEKPLTLVKMTDPFPVSPFPITMDVGVVSGPIVKVGVGAAV